MRVLTFFLCISLLTSCNYFSIQEKENSTSEIVAIVNTEKLFKKELIAVLPKNISKEDSLVLVKSYIQNWAIKKLFLEKAKNEDVPYYEEAQKQASLKN